MADSDKRKTGRENVDDSMAFSVVFYQTPDGSEPVLEFLRSQPLERRKAIGMKIRMLQHQGTNLPGPHTAFLQDGLWELRTQAEGDIYRCIYCSLPGERFLIRSAFQKKTQKMPRAELDLARRRRSDWLSRHEDAP
jgi:phage-related protein